MRIALLALVALLLAVPVGLAQTPTPAPAPLVTKTLLADPVTTYDDSTPIPAGVTVSYDLEHRYCGDTAWSVFAAGLSTPSSVRQLNAVCHEYAYVAIAAGVRSLESTVLRIDLTPLKTPSAPTHIRAQ